MAAKEFGTCRSCGARIRWAFTDKGRRMPIDPEPHPDGNLLLDPSGIATVVQQVSLLDSGQQELFRSHFVTCPFAAKHRKRGRGG